MRHRRLEAGRLKLDARRRQRAYARRVFVVDAVVICGAIALAQFGRFDLLADYGEAAAQNPIRATRVSIALGATWLAALGLLQSRDVSLVGVGSEEYRRIVGATVWVFGIAAIVSLLFQAELSRGYLMIALPLGLLGLIIGRTRMHRHLAKLRARGEHLIRVVVLGKPSSIAMLSDSIARSKQYGYSLVGACVPDFDDDDRNYISASGVSVPVLGRPDDVEEVLLATAADALAITSVERLGHDNTRRLAWRLDALGIDMIVVPGMTDIAGPRLKMRPIDNLPLFHISRPRHDGSSMYAKRVFDVIVGSCALVVLAPFMLVAAVAIKLDDRGPIIFRQERVGRRGKSFRISKFRTMTVGAHLKQDAVRTVTVNDGGVFYKSATDSRITRVGRFLRASSIDELPQLFNVLAGSMSVVGPRPLVPGEGAKVEQFVERRALVKPGMTGLWQVSGRSDVSDEERIRLDYSYVDNWSYVQDLVIVWQTVRAVIRRKGAY